MKSTSPLNLCLVTVTGFICSCAEEEERSQTESIEPQVKPIIERVEKNNSGTKGRKVVPLSESEQREALQEMLSSLDQSRENLGLDENSSTPVFGSMTYSNGGKYVGSFKNGKRHGLGSFVFPNGDRFRGYYVNGKRKGYGIYEFVSGERYEGHFESGKYHLWGLYVFENGDRYFGQYNKGKREGRGTLSKKSGERYEGDFVDGKKEGFGACIFADGSRYSGTWKNDRPEGWGTYLHPGQNLEKSSTEASDENEPTVTQQNTSTRQTSPETAAVLDREVADLEKIKAKLGSSEEDLSQLQDLPSPAGFANGNKETPTSTDLKNPANEDGFLDFDNGDRYAGQLLEGKPHGQGAYLFANGERYIGDFLEGDYEGQGLFTFSDGSRYLGQWKESRFHGQGILYDREGKVKRNGKWSFGNPAKEN